MLAQALYSNTSFAVPRFLFLSSRYNDLSLPAKLIYALLIEGLQYSRKRNWFDSHGDVYVLLPQEAIGKSLCISKFIVKRATKELVQHHLITVKQQGLCLPNRIYVHEPIIRENELNEDICRDLLLG